MVAKASGYSLITELGTDKKIERDTLMCCHCNKHFFVKPGSTGHYEVPRCTCCNDWICYNPACKATCTPLEQRLQRAEYFQKWT